MVEINNEQLSRMIDEAVRLAFIEREKGNSTDAVANRKEKKKSKEMMEDVLHRLGVLTTKSKTTDQQVKLLSEKIDAISSLQQQTKMELKQTKDLMNEQFDRIEKKIDSGLAQERTKRMALFSRWAKQHGSDMERAQMSWEDALQNIEKNTKQEWSSQTATLRELTEKLDIVLIRRMGYLPNPGLNQFFQNKNMSVQENNSNESNTITTQALDHSLSSSLMSSSPGEMPLTAMFNQGVGMNYVLGEMEDRMNELSLQIESAAIAKGRENEKNDMVERRRRAKVMNMDDEDYNDYESDNVRSEEEQKRKRIAKEKEKEATSKKTAALTTSPSRSSINSSAGKKGIPRKQSK